MLLEIALKKLMEKRDQSDAKKQLQLDPEYQKFIDILKVKEQIIKKLQQEVEDAKRFH